MEQRLGDAKAQAPVEGKGEVDEPAIKSSGKKRREPDRQKVAERVKGFPVLERTPNVVPLNPGFFQLEAARMRSVTKKKSAKRKRIRS